MKPLFKDPRVQDEADRNGCVIVPLFDPSQVEILRHLYTDSIDQAAIRDLYESSRNSPSETNQRINQTICAEIERSARELFEPCQVYGGTFMVKSHKDSTILPLHQDWSVVEESEHATWFIWCPLQQVSSRNGGLFVVEGSHKYFDGLRSGSYSSDRYVLPHQLERAITSITLKEGEALVYSDRLFHGSYANSGTEDRVVVTGRIIEQGGKLVYFQKRNQDRVDVYGADEAFYLSQIDSLAKGLPPRNMKKLYTRDYRHQPVTEERLQSRIRQSLSEQPETPAGYQLFQDQQLQEAFDRDGYVLVDLIAQEQVEDLLSFYRNLDHAPMPQHGFQVSLDNRRPDFVKAVSEKLTNTVKPFVDNKFQDHRLFTASFVVKEKNPHGVVPPHQDWTFVDEQKYWSATIWCTLVDTDIDNGALGVISGSHRFYDHVRPSPSPQYEPPFKDQLFSIFPYLNIINMKAGQALVFDNRTLHASLPNTKNETRISFGLGITHRSAELRHFYLLPNQKDPRIQQYEVEPEFFLSYNNARLAAMHTNGEQPHDLNKTGLFAYTCKQYEIPQLQQMIEDAGNVRNDKLVETMAALFNYNLDGTRKEDAGDLTRGTNADALSWWQVYTPKNIYLESRYRLAQLSRRLHPVPAFKEESVEGHPARVGEFYDTHHDSFLRVYGPVIQAFRTKKVDDLLDQQMKSMGLRPGQTVLDAGCGVAKPALYFAKKAGVQVDAITISQKQFAAAATDIEAEGLSSQVRVVRGDYHRLQEYFAPASYDVVYFLESFGHSSAKKQLLDTCWAMLKPGGLLYIKDLFRRLTVLPQHAKQIEAEIRTINQAYRYEVGELNDVLTYIRQKGYILASVTTVDLKLEDFEDLTISNEFQNLTGIAKIENWADYVFPVEFFEIKCIKPSYDVDQRVDRYFLQHLYHRQMQQEEQKARPSSG